MKKHVVKTVNTDRQLIEVPTALSELAGNVGSPAIIGFGNLQSSGASSTAYVHPWWLQGVMDGATERQLPVPFAGTVSNLYIRNSVPLLIGGGGTAIFTVRKNGVDTLLTATFSVDQQQVAEDPVNNFTVARGDVISLKGVFNAAFNLAFLTNFYAVMQVNAS